MLYILWYNIVYTTIVGIGPMGRIPPMPFHSQSLRTLLMFPSSFLGQSPCFRINQKNQIGLKKPFGNLYFSYGKPPLKQPVKHGTK